MIPIPQVEVDAERKFEVKSAKRIVATFSAKGRRGRGGGPGMRWRVWSDGTVEVDGWTDSSMTMDRLKELVFKGKAKETTPRKIDRQNILEFQ